ncbi:MAG: hypothetical protein S4CHLAM37_07020 [Chlamydiia bacterium]|nr:hypothetical protein [Chlamydiia bacterium]
MANGVYEYLRSYIVEEGEVGELYHPEDEKSKGDRVPDVDDRAANLGTAAMKEIFESYENQVPDIDIATDTSKDDQVVPG